ncbi:ATP synthase E chain-domain-containing protein [Biscogniauxia sp. FL1348]|nr:ATP synthase E chain-domain-containing protein [Biscogniauxia sp. FL1348]
MSSSSGVNVLRYSALAFGVFYGFTHQRSITAAQKAAAAQREYEHKQQLIEQARAEYNKSKHPQVASTEKSACTSPSSSSLSLFLSLSSLPPLLGKVVRARGADGSSSEPRPDGPQVRSRSLPERPRHTEAIMQRVHVECNMREGMEGGTGCGIDLWDGFGVGVEKSIAGATCSTCPPARLPPGRLRCTIAMLPEPSL